MFLRKFIIVLTLGVLIPISFVNAGNVLNSYKYAWSNNSGYINFNNVIVDNNILSGYAWSANHGWIKFNPALGGVLNDGNGNLSGYAWGEQLGWISFNNVKINNQGRFTGTATGTLIGTINFDCPNYCDVRTDWSQSTTTATTTQPITASTTVYRGNSSGSSIRLAISDLLSKHVNSYNSPLLIMPYQSGLLKKDIASGGTASVIIPANNISKKSVFVIYEEGINDNNKFLILNNSNLINNSFYDVYAIDEDNNFINSFIKPITITLPIQKGIVNNGNLRLYWLNETNMEWVLIPDAVFKEGFVTVNINHLTKFAIFSVDNLKDKIETNNQSSTSTKKDYINSLPLSKDNKIINDNEKKIEDIEKQIQNLDFNKEKTNKNWIWILIAIFVAYYIYKKRRK